MPLQGKRPFVQNPFKTLALLPICGLRPVDDRLVVDFRDHPLAFHLDIQVKPFVIVCGCVKAIHDAIQTGGFFGIVISVIHLAFKTYLGPALVLKARVKVNPRIGMGGE